MCYLDYLYIEYPEGDSLTSMTVCAGGPSQARRCIVGVRRRILKKNMVTLSRGVSDRHDGLARWTVMGMAVHHMCPLKDTWKKMRHP